jgi:hypothetical protein
MNQSTVNPPTTKRKFANIWGELDYLCTKVRFWLYTRRQRPKALLFLDRLERTLQSLPENNAAIIREEAMALVCELNGDISKSILHRKREIRLMERLHREAKSPRYDESTRKYLLYNRDANALNERRAILESLVKNKPSAQQKLGA